MFPADKEDENEMLDAEWATTSNWVFAEVTEKNEDSVTIQILGYLHKPEHEEFREGSNVKLQEPSGMVGPKGDYEVVANGIKLRLQDAKKGNLNRGMRSDDFIGVEITGKEKTSGWEDKSTDQARAPRR